MIKNWIAILALLLCSAIPAAATCSTTWTLANAQFDSTFTSGTGMHLLPAFSNSLTPGSVIIVSATYHIGGGDFITGVTDTAGNTYLDSGAGQVSPTGGPIGNQLFYAFNSSSTASNVVTVNYSTTGDFFYNGQSAEFTSSGTITLDTFSGIQLQNSTGSGSVDSIFLTPVTAAANCDLIVAVAGNLTGDVMSPGITANTWTSAIATEGYNALTMEYFVKPTTGSIIAAFLDANSESFDGIVLAFLGSGTTPPLARHRLIID